jgi:hypothetical protein
MPGSLSPKDLHTLVNLPLDESHSRLGPYKELILRWRRQGRGYTRIRELLAEKCSVTISRQVLTRFIKRHSKARKAERDLQDQLDLDLEPATPLGQASSSGSKRLTPEERAAAVAHIRSLNSKPVVKEQQPPSGWDLLEPDNVSFRPKGDK